MANSTNQIGFNDLFNFNDRDIIIQAIKDIKELRASYNEFKSDVSGKNIGNFESSMGNLAGEIAKVAKATESLNITNEKSQAALAANLQLIEKLRAENEALKRARDGARTSEDALADSVDGLTKRLKEQIVEFRKLSKSGDELKLKTLASEIAQTRTEIKSLNDATKATTAIMKNAAGSYNELEAQTKQLIKDYKALGDVEGVNKTRHEQLGKQIASNTQLLKQYDQQINQNFRNVGNYKSAFDGIGMSFQQITRELPAFANTLQTGFMAISNNIPMLVDQLQALKQKNVELAAEGKPTTSVFKSLVGAMFSWQTALSLGVTLLTVYGAKLVEWVSELMTGKTAINQMKVNIEALNEVMKAANQDASKQINDLKILYSVATDANVPLEERKNAILALKKEFPEYFSKLSDEIIMNGDAKKSYEELTASIIKASRAKAAKDKLDALSAQRLDIDFQKAKIEGTTAGEKKRAKDLKLYDDDGALVTTRTADEEKRRIEQRRVAALAPLQEQEKSLKQQEEFLLKFVGGEREVAKAIGLTYDERKKLQEQAAKDDKKAERELEQAIKKKDDLIQASAKYQIAQAELTYSKSAQTVADEIGLENKKLAILRESFELRSNLYQKDSKQYIAIQAEKAKAEADYNNKVVQIKDKDIQNRAKLEQAQLEIKHQYSKKNYDTEVQFEQDKLDILVAAFNARLALYQKDSDEYKALLSGKVQAEAQTAARIEAINKARAQGKSVAEAAQAGVQAATVSGERRLAVATSANPQAAQADLEKTQHEEKMMQLNIEVAQKQAALINLKEGDLDYYNTQKSLADAQKALVTEKYDWEIKEAERAAEQKKALEQAVFDFATTTAGALFDLGRDLNERNQQALEVEKNKELELAGNNAAAKKKIEENYQKELMKLKRKQAIYDKLQALFNIAVNTATGVSAALANPYTAPFVIPMIIATGAVQAAVVLARPLPKYATGRKGGKAELAEINEQGPELLEKNGSFRFANMGKRGAAFLQEGEKVHTAEATKRIIEDMVGNRDSEAFLDSLLKGTGVVRAYEQRKEEKMIQALVQNGINQHTLGTLFQEAVSDIPVNVTELTERGLVTFTAKRNSRIQHQNNRNKLGSNG